MPAKRANRDQRLFTMVDAACDQSRKRTRDLEAATQRFTAVFGKIPRPVQQKALAFLSEGERSSLDVVEIDTGGGKSLVGVWYLLNSVLRDNDDSQNAGQGLYVCATIGLQTQLAMDSQTWTLPPDFKIACLFGKDQYWCPKRIRILLSDAKIKLPDALRSFLRDQLDLRMRDQPDEWFFQTPRKRFESFVQRKRVFAIEKLSAEMNQIWSDISACTSCSCYEDFRESALQHCEPNALSDFMLERLNCPHGYARLLGSRAAMLIINMSLVFTYLAHRLPLIKPNTYVVIDEAHLVAKKADPLWNLPPRFDPEKVESLIDSWGDAARSAIASGVRHRDFTECCERNENYICFERCRDTQKTRSPPTLGERVATHWKFAELRPYVRAQCKLAHISAQASFVEELFSDETSRETDLETRLGRMRKRLENPHHGLSITDIVKLRGMDLDCVATHSELSADDADEDGAFEQTIALSAEALRRLRSIREPSTADFEEVGRDLNRSLVQVQLERARLLTSDEVSGIRLLKREVKDWTQRSPMQQLESLRSIAKTIVSTISAMRLAYAATTEEAWCAENKLFVPNLSRDGIVYEASMSLRKEKLTEHLWKNLVDANGALVMSATLVDPSMPLDERFTVFESEVGLDHAEVEAKVRRFVGDPVFDRTLVTFRLPRTTHNYNYVLFKRDEAARRAYLEDTCARIASSFLAGRKSAIVLCPNLKEVNDIRLLLRDRIGHVRHIDFKDSIEYKKFVSGEERALIYGSDGMCTGIDLPGRVDLVVITRKWNEPWRPVQYSYEKKYLEQTMISKMRQYVRLRHTTQAVGRLQRCHTDSGVVLFLGENDDAKLIRDAKYPNAALMLS